MSESRDTLERITALERKVERLIGLDKNTMWIFDKLESRIAALEGTASRRDPDPVCGCQRNGFECDGSCEEYEERMQRRREEVAPAQPATVDAGLLRERIARAIFREMNNLNEPNHRYEFDGPEIGDKACLYSMTDAVLAAIQEGA